MRVLRQFTDSLAYRYWRRRNGWSASHHYLYLRLPVHISPEHWEAIEGFLNAVAEHVALDRVEGASLTLPLFPFALDGTTPADNADSLLERWAPVLPRLLPYEEQVSDIVITGDRIILMPPRESQFLDSIGELHNSSQAMGPSLSQYDPFNVAIDLAYCRLDGVWPDLAAIARSASLPRFVTVSSSSVEVAQVRLAGSRYEYTVIHQFDSTPTELPASLIRRFTSKDSGREALPDEPRPETPIIWHTDRRFSLQLNKGDGVPHALEDFLRQTSSDLQLEYARIQRRVHEDPGTAGDEGEENWREIFERWLPATYHVRTKGRILTRDGVASPQVDVVVLSPDYPAALRGKKLYFAEGVVAAFECKLTLRKKHFESIRKLARFIGDTSKHPSGETGVQHAQSRPIFGVLAHSSEWDHQSGIAGLADQFRKILSVEQHPREAIDVLCIADNCTWTHEIGIMPASPPGDPHNMRYRISGPAVLHTQYLRWQSGEDNMSQVAPLYLLIRKLWHLFAAVDPTVANLAGYLQASPLAGAKGNLGIARAWPLDIIQLAGTPLRDSMSLADESLSTEGEDVKKSDQ